jgi:hypothetical protein
MPLLAELMRVRCCGYKDSVPTELRIVASLHLGAPITYSREQRHVLQSANWRPWGVPSRSLTNCCPPVGDYFPVPSASLSRGKLSGGVLLACFHLFVFANTQAP